jgi:hypothetical protein
MSYAAELAQLSLEKSALSPEQERTRERFERLMQLEKRERGAAKGLGERAEDLRQPASIGGVARDIGGAMIPDASLYGLPARLGLIGGGAYLGHELMKSPTSPVQPEQIRKVLGKDLSRPGRSNPLINLMGVFKGLNPEVPARGFEEELLKHLSSQPDANPYRSAVTAKSVGEALRAMPTAEDAAGSFARRGPVAEAISEAVGKYAPALKGVTETLSPPMPNTMAQQELIEEVIQRMAPGKPQSGTVGRLAKMFTGRGALGTVGGGTVGAAIGGIPEMLTSLYARMTGGRQALRARMQASQALSRAESHAAGREKILKQLRRSA